MQREREPCRCRRAAAVPACADSARRAVELVAGEFGAAGKQEEPASSGSG